VRAFGGRPTPDRRRARILALATAVLLLDQLSKAWALQALPEGVVRGFLPGVLQLRRIANTGAAFSLFTGSGALLGLVSALVSVALLGWILLRPPAGRWRGAGLALLLGGAMGNGIDRWRQGWVLDFLEFVPVHFPVFNLADVAINAAVLCLLIDLLPSPPSRDA
jgi:signal peptidase II